MKIRREEDRMITPCKECLFYDGDCRFGRIEKYTQLGKFKDGEVQTFCNHARPNSWLQEQTMEEAEARVKKENRVKYDIVFRINSVEDVDKVVPFISNRLVPANIIFSFTDLSIKNLVEKCVDLGHEFELLQIKDEEDRPKLEFNRVKQPWYLTISDNFSTNLVNDLNDKINNDLDQIVAVFGDQQMIMSMLGASLEYWGIPITEENIVKISEGQNLCVRQFNGLSIEEYT